MGSAPHGTKCGFSGIRCSSRGPTQGLGGQRWAMVMQHSGQLTCQDSSLQLGPRGCRVILALAPRPSGPSLSSLPLDRWTLPLEWPRAQMLRWSGSFLFLTGPCRATFCPLPLSLALCHSPSLKQDLCNSLSVHLFRVIQIMRSYLVWRHPVQCWPKWAVNHVISFWWNSWFDRVIP